MPALRSGRRFDLLGSSIVLAGVALAATERPNDRVPPRRGYLQPSSGIVTVLGMHFVRTGFGVGLVALVAVASAPAAAQQEAGSQQTPAFHTEVEVVSHSVAVVDREGNPVRGLQLSDFTVYEDDERQQISVFLSPDDSPLDVALVIDSSASLFHYDLGRASCIERV